MVACELPKGKPPEALRCPRCDSSDTKFCYYNNYNTSQPRHFCKSCKRYWTAGGTLRNVPVGGGLRKNKKSKLLSHVKDMITSSSSEELFHGGLPVGSSYVFPQEGFPYEVPQPLSYAPPLFMPSSSSSADGHGDGALGSSYTFQNISGTGFGYFGENRLDGDYVMPGMDPHSLDVRQHAQYHEDYSQQALPVQQQGNGGIQGFHGSAGADQAQSHSGGVSEAPSELSQASSEVAKDPYLSQSVELQQSDVQQSELGQMGWTALKHVQGDESVVRHQSTTHEPIQSREHGILPPSGEGVVPQNSQSRGKSSIERDDDEIGNVVKVRYPYDWEQVSEVLLGGTPDFFQLSTY